MVGIFSGSNIFTNSTGVGTVLWEYKKSDGLGLDFRTSGNASGQMAIIADSLEVTYIYTAVPEPSSTALLGIGGLALMLRRRR